MPGLAVLPVPPLGLGLTPQQLALTLWILAGLLVCLAVWQVAQILVGLERRTDDGAGGGAAGGDGAGGSVDEGYQGEAESRPEPQPQPEPEPEPTVTPTADTRLDRRRSS